MKSNADNEKTSNPKIYRTEREENLCVQFMMNDAADIQKHTASFKEAYQTAAFEEDLNEKIKLLKNVVNLYEKGKNWFYRTKGGMIYFQDFYEHMHNSRNEDFSYLPDESRSEIQQIIRELEGDSIINRTKKGNSYLLTINQHQ